MDAHGGTAIVRGLLERCTDAQATAPFATAQWICLLAQRMQAGSACPSTATLLLLRVLEQARRVPAQQTAVDALREMVVRPGVTQRTRACALWALAQCICAPGGGACCSHMLYCAVECALLRRHECLAAALTVLRKWLARGATALPIEKLRDALRKVYLRIGAVHEHSPLLARAIAAAAALTPAATSFADAQMRDTVVALLHPEAAPATRAAAVAALQHACQMHGAIASAFAAMPETLGALVVAFDAPCAERAGVWLAIAALVRHAHADALGAWMAPVCCGTLAGIATRTGAADAYPALVAYMQRGGAGTCVLFAQPELVWRLVEDAGASAGTAAALLALAQRLVALMPDAGTTAERLAMLAPLIGTYATREAATTLADSATAAGCPACVPLRDALRDTCMLTGSARALTTLVRADAACAPADRLPRAAIAAACVRVDSGAATLAAADATTALCETVCSAMQSAAMPHAVRAAAEWIRALAPRPVPALALVGAVGRTLRARVWDDDTRTALEAAAAAHGGAPVAHGTGAGADDAPCTPRAQCNTCGGRYDRMAAACAVTDDAPPPVYYCSGGFGTCAGVRCRACMLVDPAAPCAVCSRRAAFAPSWRELRAALAGAKRVCAAQ